MTIAALIPFKDVSQAKTRLARVLSEERRRQLALQMLDHVVGVLIGVGDIDSITVLSPAPPEIEPKVNWLRDLGRGLNPEIEAAMQSLSANKVLIIHADLPQLTHEDIQALVVAAEEHDVAIAPDKAGTGTNALLINPKADFKLSFGVGSFQAHSRDIAARGWSLGTVNRPGLSLDIDDPADLKAAGLDK
jgi:2-phospho-L-lactate guanylyltransferase